MRLINADELAEELSKRVWYKREDEKQAVRIVKEFPTVDAVPVVRCKDCANYAGDGMYCAWDLLTGDMGYCHHGYVADRSATEETGADGERKGGDE